MGDLEEKLNAILGNQAAMGQIMAIAQSLGGQKEEGGDGEQEDGYVHVSTQEDRPDLGAILGNVDPNMVQMGMKLLQEYNRSDDRNTALLAALRPFVKAERYAKVDRAMQIARLSRVIRALFDTMKEKGDGWLV